ncbi:MAG: hypothetical protein EA350_07045 [Gemmatimonadales bacterium]|nr:MAG: hypothetical protein EA350_07045 [Gemmatimonadales bacterium]
MSAGDRDEERPGDRPGWRPDEPPEGGPQGPNPYAGTREELDRAIRRLDALEWIILFAAVGFALGGGALVAWMLSAGTGLGFRSTWIVLSLLLLVIPGGIVFLKERGRGK